MKETEFFKLYIPALYKALENKTANPNYNIFGPDWYIEDDIVRNEMYLFENDNYDEYSFFFDKVALYFDAKAHNFDEIEGVKIEKYLKLLEEDILTLEKRFNTK